LHYQFFPEVLVKRSLAVAVLVVLSGILAARAADSAAINGWVSDSMCGAKHAGSGSACVKKCIQGGGSPVFVDEEKKAVWSIDNPDAVKSFYGEHVTIKGTPNAETKSIHVDSVTAAK
jgi:hypothetical protein